MKTKKNRLIKDGRMFTTIVVIVLMIIQLVGTMSLVTVSSQGVESTGYVITQITDGTYSRHTLSFYPKVNDNGIAVWESYDGTDDEIYLYDGTSIIQITDNSITDVYPDINNNGHVVWGGYDGDWEVYLYDGTSITKLTDNSVNDGPPKINDNGIVAWPGYDGADYEIFLYDGSSITQITDNSIPDGLNLNINNNGQMVWTGGDKPEGAREIYLYDGSSVIRITDNSYVDAWPEINDNGIVVWRGSDEDGHPQVYLYDGSSITNLSITTYNTGLPKINNNGIVVWTGMDENWQYQLYLYDGSSTTQITDNYPLENHDARINDNGIVVWRARETEDDYTDIYLYDGSSIIRITDNSHNDLFKYGDLSNRGHIVWLVRHWYEPIYDLYLASPTLDTDGDGLTDLEELAGWDITIRDCFGNPIDSYHVTSDPLQADEDGDGLNDLEERNGWNVIYLIENPYPPPEFVWIAYLVSSNPREADWDNDGLNDWEEGVHKTDPNRANTDCDGAWDTNDGFEVEYGLNPVNYDTDGDGIKDGLEIDLWIEVAGYDPANPELVPQEVLLWAVSKTNDPVIPAFVDIEPDTLNLKSNGEYITCYIELPEGYSVADIDISTILLNGIVSAELEPTAIGDYDLDGIPDLMVKFYRAEVMGLIGETNDYEEGSKYQDVQLTITGELTDETPFEGKDTVKVILK